MTIVIFVFKKKIIHDLTLLGKILFFSTGLVRLRSGWVRMFFSYSTHHSEIRYLRVIRGSDSEVKYDLENLKNFPEIPSEWVQRIDITATISDKERIYRELSVATIAEAKQLVTAFDEKGESGIARWPGKQYQLTPISFSSLPEFCCEYHEGRAAEEEGGPDPYGMMDGIF